MSKLIPIITIGNILLCQQATSVQNIDDPHLQELIDNLTTTAGQANGVGIAAPQVGECLRLLIVASRPNQRYPDAPFMEPTAIINPIITGHSPEVVKGWEGCLSVPGVRGLVPRYQWVELSYTDRYGNLQKRKFTGFVARIFQHEYDHLEGILFIDRVEDTNRIITEDEYKQVVVTNT